MKYNQSYLYYYRKIIPFFFASLYTYTNSQALPRLRAIKFEINIFGSNSRYAFLKNFFILLITLMKSPQVFARNYRAPGYMWRYIFRYGASDLFLFYTKYITAITGRIVKSPLAANFHSNNEYSYTLRPYNTPETFFYELNVYDQIFHGHMVIRFVFKQNARIALEQQNFLRMLNLPLYRKK